MPTVEQVLILLRKARIALFLVGITLPLAGFCFQIRSVNRLNSKRDLAPFPRLGSNPIAWAKFIRKYREYFSDHFGYREEMIRLHAHVNFRLFGITPNENVIVGKEGWFFLGEYQESLEYIRNAKPFTPSELADWSDLLKRRHDYLKAKGIHYLFFVAPNKDTIYPELLPDSLQRLNPQSRLDQLMEYLKEHSDVPVLDLRPKLVSAKKAHQLYYKADTHWNKWGAYMATEAIHGQLQQWFPMIDSFKEEDYIVKTSPKSFRGDLLDLGALADEPNEDSVSITPVTKRARSAPVTWGQSKQHEFRPFATAIESTASPRIVVFRDSFFVDLHPFVSEFTQRAVYVWQSQFEADIVNREPCDVVIHEMAERFLMRPIPSDSYADE